MDCRYAPRLLVITPSDIIRAEARSILLQTSTILTRRQTTSAHANCKILTSAIFQRIESGRGFTGTYPSSQAPREPCSGCNDVSERHYTLYPGEYAEISQPGMTRPLHPLISGTGTQATQSPSATSPRYACSQALTSPFTIVPIEQPLTCSSGVDAHPRGYIRSVTPSPADEANFQGLRRRGLLWNLYRGVEECWREEYDQMRDWCDADGSL